MLRTKMKKWTYNPIHKYGRLGIPSQQELTRKKTLN